MAADRLLVARRALEHHPAAVRLDNPLHEAQAEAGALYLRRDDRGGPVERLEDASVVRGMNADAAVYDGYEHYAQALAITGEWDLVCCGHDHRAAITPVTTIKNSTTLLLNPGTVAGVGAKATYIIGDLETLQFEIRDVPLPGAHTPQPKV